MTAILSLKILGSAESLNKLFSCWFDRKMQKTKVGPRHQLSKQIFILMDGYPWVPKLQNMVSELAQTWYTSYLGYSEHFFQA